MMEPEKKLVIALDFDGTYTEDPEGWQLFVHMMKARGHEVHIVTYRDTDWDNSDIEEACSKMGIKPLFTAGKQKQHVFKADIWIDDNPALVAHYALMTAMVRGCEANGDIDDVR
jgi:hypothetical protein